MSLLNVSLDITKFTSSFRFKLVIDAYKNWLVKNDRVLDIGSGNGIITKSLADYFSVKIIGCDVKNYMIYNIPFIKFDGKKLPFKKDAFNIALLNDVLHHIAIEEQENLILEAVNVAKKVLIFDAEPTISGKIADVILNKYHYGNLSVPLSFRNIKEWQGLFKKLSLRWHAQKLRRPFWYPFSHIAFEVQKV